MTLLGRHAKTMGGVCGGIVTGRPFVGVTETLKFVQSSHTLGSARAHPGTAATMKLLRGTGRDGVRAAPPQGGGGGVCGACAMLITPAVSTRELYPLASNLPYM
jgi:hypothetical protein